MPNFLTSGMSFRFVTNTLWFIIKNKNISKNMSACFQMSNNLVDEYNAGPRM